MRHFVYTYSEGRSSRFSSGTPYTVRIYRMIKNSPVLVAKSTDYFMSEFQQVMTTLDNAKALPRAAFYCNSSGGYKYCQAYLLRDAGFANINRID